MTNAQRLAALALYTSSFTLGLVMVSFPASSPFLKELHGFSDAQYGSIFIPQVILTVVGAVGGGGLASRLGVLLLLRVALATSVLSQALLASLLVLPAGPAYGALLAATGSFGLAFGLVSAPLNSLPGRFFPSRASTALVAVHTMLGVGLAVGPLLVGTLRTLELWPFYPLGLAVLALLLLLLTLAGDFPASDGEGSDQASTMETANPRRSVAFWALALIAFFYALAEGTFANWAVLYLTDARALPEPVAAGALSAFWGALAAGRLVVSALVVRVPARWVWIFLPALMILAFLLLPGVDSGTSGVLVFAFAGLACSAFFPLTVDLASQQFPGDVAWVSSMLMASLMVGVGVGTYVLGALRSAVSFETLYQISAIEPLLVLGLGLAWLLWARR